MKTTLIRVIALLFFASGGGVCSVGALQVPTGLPAGTVAGTIVDAASGSPLRGAVVILEPRPAGSIRASGSEAIWSRGLSAQTDASGRYRFNDIPLGQYRLLVRRLGYRPATVFLDITRTQRLRVSVGLNVQPIRLERALSTAQAPTTFAPPQRSTEAASDARLMAEKIRQDLFLESDARLVSESDVVEAVTLAENDVFRALHRLPGVATRDEFTAALWTRGAPWSQTRVYFDGMPLFNPVHSAGVFSGVNPDGLGAVFFHPGSRSASIGEGAAGVVNLTSRRWRGQHFGGSAGVSVASTRLSLGGPFPNNGAWSVSSRRSYLDLLTSFVSDSADQIPYAFMDVTGRIDVPVGNNSVLEASWLWDRDAVWGTVPGLLRDNEGRWGNAAGQISLSTQLGSFFTRHTLGFSRFDGNMSVLQYVTGDGSDVATPNHAPIENGLTYVTLRSTIEPSNGSSGDVWAFGYDLDYQGQRFLGPYPRPFPSVDVKRTFGRRAEAVHLSVWGEKRWNLGALQMQVGLRSEFSGDVANTAPVGFAPRLSARYALAPNVTVSASYGRSYQYTQAIAPAGTGIGPDLHLTDVWLLASDTVPAIRSDVKTVGAEAWLGGGWLGSATFYTRLATGVAIPDPTPGTRVLDTSIFVPAFNRAAGLEISLRRLIGPVTTSLGYAFGVSEMRAVDLVFPATAGRRHQFDATATTQFGRDIRLGAAFMAASGARFTRVHLGPIGCVSGDLLCPDTLFTTTLVEDPGAAKAPSFVSLDLIGEWTRTFASWQFGFTVQVKNVLHRQNAMTYLGTYSGCTRESPLSRMVTPGVCDRFYRGLPLLPLVGVYARF